jgi:hypothetical protein
MTLILLSGLLNQALIPKTMKLSSLHQQNANPEFVFPLVGREKSLKNLASCFTTTYRNRFVRDQNARCTPICVGIPGIGKSLLQECPTTVFDMTAGAATLAALSLPYTLPTAGLYELLDGIAKKWVC